MATVLRLYSVAAVLLVCIWLLVRVSVESCKKVQGSIFLPLQCSSLDFRYTEYMWYESLIRNTRTSLSLGTGIMWLSLASIVIEGYTTLSCQPCNKSAPLTIYVLMTWKRKVNPVFSLAGLLGMC